jgi:hypothetical protein
LGAKINFDLTRRGAASTADEMRVGCCADLTRTSPCLERPAASEEGTGEGGTRSQARMSAGAAWQAPLTPTPVAGRGHISPRAANEMRLGMRRQSYRAPDARALHNMREAAGGLGPAGPTRGSPNIKRGCPPGPWMECGLGLRRAAHCEPDVDAFHSSARPKA